MSKSFSRVSRNRPKRNPFDLSIERKQSMRFGHLTPILCQEVLPGDTFSIGTTALIRFAPLVAPMMHRVDAFMHYFFVPNRLVWSEWEQFITGGEKGEFLGDNVPVVPYVEGHPSVANLIGLAPYFAKYSLWDMMGLPVLKQTVGDTMVIPKVSQLPFRGYQLIYNEWYRDQNLSNKIEIPMTGGVHFLPNYNVQLPIDDPLMINRGVMLMRNRNWRKDYFTSALPTPQKGPEVRIPVVGDVVLHPDAGQPGTGRYPFLVDQIATGNMEFSNVGMTHVSGEGQYNNRITHQPPSTAHPLLIDPHGSLTVESGMTLNEFRFAHRLQRWFERNMRSGSRYAEFLRAHFGVSPRDERLQRPEYLGGGRLPIQVSEVLQTSSTDSTSPQGNMAGHGVGVGKFASMKRNFYEHGFIIGILSVVPQPTYDGVIHRQFLKRSPFDYYFPEFAHLGEQEIKHSEINWSWVDDPEDQDRNESTWGYQERYSEYKFNFNTVHGDFHDNLAFWHMARSFDPNNAVPLNEEFIRVTQSDNITRVFAIDSPNVDLLWCQLFHDIKAIRPVPVYSTPTI